jgi:hypothetical protein
MNARIKQLWLDALESGKYKHGINALHWSNDTYCCLGVLCDLYQQETGNLRWERMYSDDYGVEIYAFGVDIDDDPEGSVLPLPVAEWAELSSSPISYDGGVLTEINDSARDYGPAIAFIKEYL